MKKTILSIILVMIFSILAINAQDQQLPKNAIRLDQTVLKDESGNIIDMQKFVELMNTGNWAINPVKNTSGEVLYVQLRKMTEEEKKQKSSQSEPLPASELVGKKAPDFKMKDMNGNIISSKDASGKVIVLNFWFTTCQPCINEIPELNNVYEKYKSNKDVIFAAIALNKPEEIASFLKKNPLQYPIVADAKDISNLFGIKGYPTNIVIDRNGKYYSLTLGGIPEIGKQISGSIKDALSNKPPSPISLPKNETNIKSGSVLTPAASTTIRIDPNSVFKMGNGEIIKIEKAMELLNSNEYILETKKDENGMDYYLIKKNR